MWIEASGGRLWDVRAAEKIGNEFAFPAESLSEVRLLLPIGLYTLAHSCYSARGSDHLYANLGGEK